MAPSILKSETLAAAHTSIGFVTMRCLAEAKKLPWCLGVGDVDSNLDSLLEGPVPQEPMAAKVHQLLSVGFNREQVKQALSLLLDCPWGTATVEQGHASGTLLKKFHPELGKESLVLRSFFHSFRRLLPGPTEGEKVLAAAEAKVQKLLAKEPQKVTGRHMYFKALMSTAEAWRTSGKRKLPADVQRAVMQKHGSSWQALPKERKMQFAKEAAWHRSASEQALLEDIGRESQQLAIARGRLADEAASRPPLSLHSARLSLADLSQIGSTFSSGTFTDKMVAKLRSRAEKAPAAPGPELVKQLEAIAIWEDKPTAARPEWLSPLCWNREVFHNSALVFEVEGQLRYFKLLFALQKPLFASFSPLEEVDQYPLMSISVCQKSWDALSKDHFARRFEASYMVSLPWTELPTAGLESTWVLRHLEHTGGVEVASDDDLLPLKDLLAQLPKKVPEPAQPSQSSGQQTAAISSSVVKSMPYLSGFLKKQAEAAKATEAPASVSDKEGEASGTPVVGDEEIQALFKALEMKRLEHQDEAGDFGDFKVTLLGGEWLMATQGKAFDAFRGGVRAGSVAEDWCNQYSLNRSARFDISRYGEQGARIMASAWQGVVGPTLSQMTMWLPMRSQKT
eukprot:11228301-Lingulodinium_polyedra.AAC.1